MSEVVIHLSNNPKPKSYWVITIVGWALVTFLAGTAIVYAIQKDWSNAIAFAVLVTLMLLMMYPPVWLQRFAVWHEKNRPY